MVFAAVGIQDPFYKPRCVGRVMGARIKEGGNATDIGRKEKKGPTLWGTPSPEMALGSSWPRGLLRPERQAISLRVTFLSSWE